MSLPLEAGTSAEAGLDAYGSDTGPQGTDAFIEAQADVVAVEAGDEEAGWADGPQDDAGTDAADAGEGGGLACNGNASYCDRPYNEVSVVCTHNAHSNEEDPGFDIPTPNQKYSFIHQLDDGVRCMMIDTYSYLGQPMLCHAQCALGATPLVPMLASVEAWMQAHPREVLTFILESYLSENDTMQALQDSGMSALIYQHGPPGTAWPTLGWMIEHDQRLVVFTDDASVQGGSLLHWPSYGWETPYNDPTFTCADGRGEPGAYAHQVFILNHYTLCPLGGCASNGMNNNLYSFLWSRAMHCWEPDPQYNPDAQIPTFVTVDHYEVPEPGEESPRPDVFDAVDAINAAWMPGNG